MKDKQREYNELLIEALRPYSNRPGPTQKAFATLVENLVAGELRLDQVFDALENKVIEVDKRTILLEQKYEWLKGEVQKANEGKLGKNIREHRKSRK